MEFAFVGKDVWRKVIQSMVTFRDEVKNVFSNSKLREAYEFSDELKELFNRTAGVSEGYSILEHTALVLKQFDVSNHFDFLAI